MLTKELNLDIKLDPGWWGCLSPWKSVKAVCWHRLMCDTGWFTLGMIEADTWGLP